MARHMQQGYTYLDLFVYSLNQFFPTNMGHTKRVHSYHILEAGTKGRRHMLLYDMKGHNMENSMPKHAIAQI